MFRITYLKQHTCYCKQPVILKESELNERLIQIYKEEEIKVIQEKWDKLLNTDIISKEYLDGCFELGQQYPNLCSSVMLICKK